jgi:predicted transcriptional regulator of viral defense system
MKRDKKRANLREFEETLKKGHLLIFSNEDIIRIFGWSKTSVKFLLHRYTRRGITTRLKNGLYMLSGATVSEFYIANRLCEPSYVSLETALSFHNIIPETVYAITSITTRATRVRTANGKSYQYHRILRSAFTGYKPLSLGDFTVLVAEPEKALVDHCYLVARGWRKPLDADRLRLKNLDRKKINDYARLFKSKKMIGLLENIMSVKL